MNYSFLTSVYRNTKESEMRECVESMLSQTVPPEQVVIVIDGPVPDELKEYIDSLSQSMSEVFTVLPLEENVGLGLALQKGLEVCRNEIVARMDTDDICVKDRMEKQLARLSEDETLSIVGSDIAEFIGTTDNVVSVRDVPQSHEEICEYLKKRCPFNHMTVTFRKSEVEKAGSYQPWYLDEDSYLWVRMYLAGCKFANIGENLVFARVDESSFRRRGGIKYYRSERDLFRFMRKNKIITWWQYKKAKWVRFIVQVLMPNGMREWFFKKFARKKSAKEAKNG